MRDRPGTRPQNKYKKIDILSYHEGNIGHDHNFPTPKIVKARPLKRIHFFKSLNAASETVFLYLPNVR
jgi:hypothetical protein